MSGVARSGVGVSTDARAARYLRPRTRKPIPRRAERLPAASVATAVTR